MSEDPYKVLGVAKTASEAEIRAAYRKLAKQFHPDMNPGDHKAEERFKEISAAYDLLGDPDKRKKFDSGEIDASGQEKQRTYYRHYAEQGPEQPYHSTAGFEDLGDLFGDLFGGRARGARGAGERFTMRGADAHYTLTVGLRDIFEGARKRVTMPDGKTLEIAIPAGVREGQILRLRGQGGPGFGGGEQGDALVEIRIAPDPVFRRDGTNIHVELPVTVAEAVLGAKVEVPTLSGPVAMTIPRHSNSGTRLRLRAKGLPAGAGGARGDQYVTLRVVLPDEPDAELEAFLRDWAAKHPHDPRSKA